MLKLRQLLTIFAAISIGLTSAPTAVLAQTSTPVEFVIPDTTLIVSGQASPGALVSIYDSNVLIGTTVAGSNGSFTKDFVGLDSGLKSLRLEYSDQSGRVSRSVTDTVSVAFQKETAVEYFLPPTLEIVPQAVTEGGLVSFRGSTVPGATVEVTVDGGNTVLRPIADSNGNYNIAFGTDGYFIGQHPVSAKAKFGGKTSFETDKISFEVLPVPAQDRDDEESSTIEPPVIISPSSPAVVDATDTLIRGTAAPNQQIIIYIDGEPVGSTFSNSEGLWFFNITITKQEHEIRAIACENSECSDFSNLLVVNFDGDLGACSGFSFFLNDYRFWGINPGKSVELEFSDIGSQTPYEMVVDWGDGVIERFNHADQNGFKIQHIFNDVGQYNGNVTIEDNDGCKLTRYFSVDVVPRNLNYIDLWWIIPLGLAVVLITALKFKPKSQKQPPKTNSKST